MQKAPVLVRFYYCDKRNSYNQNNMTFRALHNITQSREILRRLLYCILYRVVYPIVWYELLIVRTRYSQVLYPDHVIFTKSISLTFYSVQLAYLCGRTSIMQSCVDQRKYVVGIQNFLDHFWRSVDSSTSEFRHHVKIMRSSVFYAGGKHR